MTTLRSAPPPVSLRELSLCRLLSGLILRLYVGYEWLNAGKVTAPAGVWVGERVGAAVTGFLNGALAKTSGDHPDVAFW